MNTLFVGRTLIELDSIGSTNDYANSLLQTDNLPEGTVILALEQTKGRGQYGNTWMAEKGQNLLLSIVFTPRTLKATNQFYLNMSICLALYDLLVEDMDVKVKWPNDIYVGNKKVCGVLVENSLKGPKIVSSVVGIGLNVNQQNFDEDLSRASSLSKITGRHIDIYKLFERLCKRIEVRYMQLKAEKYSQIKKEYMAVLMYNNELKPYKRKGETFMGRIVDIDESGKLVLEAKNGKCSYGFKDIEFVI